MPLLARLGWRGKDREQERKHINRIVRETTETAEEREKMELELRAKGRKKQIQNVYRHHLRNHDEEMQSSQGGNSRDDFEAQLRIADKSREVERVRQQEREEIQKQENDREQKLREEREAGRRELELQKSEENKKLLQVAEKRRQRNELDSSLTSKPLRELRELIRERYELDMEIYRMRDVHYSNRGSVIRNMRKSDEILQRIQTIVKAWTPDSFEGPDGPDEMEWCYAEQVKERLLAPGKRIWATDPPWPKEEEVVS